jgi:serine/threonine-protein kinase
VCGYRLQAAPKPAPQTPAPQQQVSTGTAVKASPPRAAPKAKPKGDEIYINQVLNNRFKIESKIGEGGFGAVYRGVQLATGRKVALKLLHPEMTKDENLVARFRREGMVLCNLRDAHTITTYDFDQTPDGTLYIAMELLEGKSLHQVFHEQAPLDWKRMFKILIEMCSSLAEAHAQGIVHRDLKPENVYLETRPGNPEFVKILDFGIAKVMRGDSIDPQSPQLTATGQTLGTLEYMSPEQLMGKQLDGRSDVYALGVVAYEMITGRLPFPDAKGPAGLITAQLKQTPQPPSVANPKAALPRDADKVILKALEKDKNNRHADVTAMAAGLQEVLDHARETSNPIAQPLANSSSGAMRMQPQATPFDMLETRKGEMPHVVPPAMPHGPTGPSPRVAPAATPSPAYGVKINTPGSNPSNPMLPQLSQQQMQMQTPYPQMQPQMMTYPQASPNMYQQTLKTREPSSSRWVWWVVGLLALGATAGAVLALVMRYM